MYKCEIIEMFNVWYFDHTVQISWFDECGLRDISVNMELPVVGVSNCIIRDIILYLIARNLKSRKIYQKIVETFGEKLFVR